MHEFFLKVLLIHLHQYKFLKILVQFRVEIQNSDGIIFFISFLKVWNMLFS